MYFIGLDVGTTGVKALAVDGQGRPKALAYREYELLSPQPGWCEHDPAEVLAKVCQALAEAAAAAGGRVGGVGLSSHGQAVLPIGPAGEALYNIIVTMDGRTVPQYEWWRANVSEAQAYRRTGLPFAAMYTVNKIMWHKQHRPEIYKKAWKFCCVQDYIALQLTGQGPVMDYSLAGRTMMLDPRKKCWDPFVLELAGIPEEKLPALASSTSVVGGLKPALACQLGLPEGTPVVLGGHDQACGALGAGVVEPGMAMNASGTVEALVTALPRFELSARSMRNKYPCYPHAAAGRYVAMAVNTSGGLLLKWYKNTFCAEEKRLCEAAGQDVYTHIIEHSAPAPADVLVLPHLQGAGTPLMDPQSACAIVGLRAEHGKPQLCRAILDSLAYDLRQNLEALEQSVGSIREVRAIGGGAKTPKWLQIKADVLQKPVVTMQVSEAAALGAAILAAVGLGAWPDCPAAAGAMARPGRVYEPSAALKEAYDARYAEYLSLYPALRGVHHALRARA